MKLGKIISLLLVLYVCLKVVEKVMYDMHYHLRYVVIDVSYGVLTYLTIPLMAIWFYKSMDKKKRDYLSPF
jgi:hypothetical protein